MDKQYNNPRNRLVTIIERAKDRSGSENLKNEYVSGVRDFITQFESGRRSLQSMNTTVDEILMVLFIQKMDAITSAMFEDQISQSKFTPGFAQMDSYLDKEIRI